MARKLRGLGAVTLLCAGAASALRGQIVGERNPARPLAIVSAASLGEPVAVSLGSASGQVVFADLSLPTGAVRLLVGLRHDAPNYGLGYALPLVLDSPAPQVRTGLGAELSLRYSGLPSTNGEQSSMNAHLAVPVGLEIGKAKAVSFSLYLAPYVETGVAPTRHINGTVCAGLPCADSYYAGHHSTAAFGSGVGMRFTVWRLAIEVAREQVVSVHPYTADPGRIAFSLRL